MAIEDLVHERLFDEYRKAQNTLESCSACLANNDYEQAMVRLQMLGVIFTKFECDIISEVNQS